MIVRACLVVLLTALGSLAATAAETGPAPIDVVIQRAEQRAKVWRGPAYEALLARATGPMARLLADPNLDLAGVLPSGRPLFFTTTNLDAAATVSTDAVWPGGWTGLDLDGGNSLGELAVWDGGIARTTHQEFTGRVLVGDGATNVGNHATHVMGTILGAGTEHEAAGMSPAARARTYLWDDDELEMATAAAAGLHLSNHSYGFATGWRLGWGDSDEWHWFGDAETSPTEDIGFGFYSASVAEWDAIAHAAPHYLIVKSAGNDRDDLGPEPGGGHFYWDNSASDWVWSTTVRDPDGGSDGFDSISFRGNAKNVLTVGAVYDVPGGWSNPADVQASGFTSWGPSDDGRIKPDLVANGISLYSSIASADDAYDSYSGTSMAAPNATGSLNLILQHFQQRLGAAPLASTLKALALHTASEAGPAPGPDYMFGWGLLNTAAAAVIVDDAAQGERIFEREARAAGSDELRFYHDGAGPLKATIVWTDPAGTPPPWSLNPTTPMLVHDLDLHLVREDDNEVFRPWILDPANPAAPAVTGVNTRDNVEVVDATGAGAGAYRVIVSRSDAEDNDQQYSLVVSGLQRISLTAAADVIAAPRLLHAAPNPFNPRTEIALVVGRDTDARVAVFDARGRRVARLHHGPLTAGEHRLTWDGRDTRGRTVAAGVYLVRLEAAGHTDHLMLTLVK